MRLKARNTGFNSVEHTLDALETVQWHRAEVDGEAVTGVSVSPEQRQLFKDLEVCPPSRGNVA